MFHSQHLVMNRMSFCSYGFLVFQKTNQFCLNLSGKTKSSILLNTINRYEMMAGNGPHLEASFKTWDLAETSGLHSTAAKCRPLSAKIFKNSCTISVFKKLWSFVSAHVQAFLTFNLCLILSCHLTWDKIGWSLEKLERLMSKMTQDSLPDVANEIFYSVMKNANFMLLEIARRALMTR